MNPCLFLAYHLSCLSHHKNRWTMKYAYTVNPKPYVLLYLIGVQELQLHSPDNLP